MTRSLRSAATAAGGITLAFGGLLAAAAPASAILGDGANTCPTSYVCLWRNDTYTGNHLRDADYISSYSSVTFDGTNDNANDRVSSVASRFTRCGVRFWTNYSFTGHSMTFSYPNAGGQYQDPNLTNGGPGTTDNWDNVISSHNDVC